MRARTRDRWQDPGQRGAAAVEFALVSIAFFLLLLGILEFGRFMYVRNTVQEVTRIAAREAVVSDFTDAKQTATIQQDAVMNGSAGGDSALPAVPEITASDVRIHYLSALPDVEIPSGSMPASPEDNISACLDPDRSNSCIRFIQVEVCAGQDMHCSDPVLYQPMIAPFAFLNLAIPPSSVTMPAESLGYTQ